MKKKPIIHFLLKYGLAKTEQTAAGMLLAVAIINFFISAYMLHGTPAHAFHVPEEVLKTDLVRDAKIFER